MNKLLQLAGVLALAGLLALPLRAYAWPEGVTAFSAAMQKGDATAALAALGDDPTITLPAEMLPADTTLLSTGARKADGTLTLRGKQQVTAWLNEFLVRDGGRWYITEPAEMGLEAASLTASVVLTAPYLTRLGLSSLRGTIELRLRAGEHVVGATLILPAATRAALRRAMPTIYALSQLTVYSSQAARAY